VFNIGSEGQTLMGAFCAALAGIYWPLSSPWICGFVGFLAAFLGAGMWGGVAAWIRAFRGGHEVISSIMMNFVAAGVTGWLVTERFQAIDSQNPETAELMSGYLLRRINYFEGAPVTAGIFVVLGLVLLFFVAVTKSRAGIRLQATSHAPDAAAIAGYSVKWVRFWSFALGAAMSGIAGAVMVMGEAGRFRLGMSEGFGFLGIPVALLAKGRPFGIVWAAFLMAILHHGASALDLESTRVSRDLAQVIAALVVMAVIVIPEWSTIRRWWQIRSQNQ
jgi:simple sugar transport system permease protein